MLRHTRHEVKAGDKYQVQFVAYMRPQIGKVVGATGFESASASLRRGKPATPCAQGKLGRPLKVLILERFAASENSWAQIWAHSFGDAL